MARPKNAEPVAAQRAVPPITPANATVIVGKSGIQTHLNPAANAIPSLRSGPNSSPVSNRRLRRDPGPGRVGSRPGQGEGHPQGQPRADAAGAERLDPIRGDAQPDGGDHRQRDDHQLNPRQCGLRPRIPLAEAELINREGCQSENDPDDRDRQGRKYEPAECLERQRCPVALITHLSVPPDLSWTVSRR